MPSLPIPGTSWFAAPSIRGSWSPDGAWVLVTWLIDGTYDGGFGGRSASWVYGGDIYAVSLDGTIRVRLTTWLWGDVDADM